MYSLPAQQVLSAALPIVGTHGDTPLLMAGDKLFLGRMWQLERDLAREICRLAGAELAAADWLTVSSRLAEWFTGKGSEGQKTAAALAMLQPFMLISGVLSLPFSWYHTFRLEQRFGFNKSNLRELYFL